MAMYYQGSSEIQADGLQTLYLMNPNYVGYSDPQHPPQSNLLFLNSASSSSTLMPHAPPLPQAQQFVGFPLSHDFSRPSPVPSEEIPRFHYNRWGLDNQTNMAPQTPRGLSLTLSAHQTGLDKPISGDQYFPVPMISSKNCSSPPLTVTDQSNGVNCTMRSVLIGSKYLKAAQELLEEVANVGKDTKTDLKEPSKDKAKMNKDSIVKDNVSIGDGESGGKDGGTDLTTAQKQEIQMKKAKLNSMLDEVEQRYRQYHNQMQIVVESFEEAAGVGSARTYTQLALKTILKQFKCLKSTISAQIKALNKNLGEEEGLEKKLLEGSRLKFVDHLQIRQQRALQQMGIMQNNAWRPQRGLPEKAVSILRAWLFQHFLHPYPKDSDKQMLAKQTGLTRSQVSNWFINARVRLWKPMVEEMYLEETKNQQQITSHGNSTKQETNSKTATADPSSRGGFAQLITSMNTETLPEKNPQNGQQGASPGSILSAEMEIKAGETTDNYLSMAAANVNTYGISELDTSAFQGNSFSLTLGLPPTETDFLSRRNFEFGARIESGNGETGRVNQVAAAHQSIGYEILDFQNRKPFPAQLLPDFVA